MNKMTLRLAVLVLTLGTVTLAPLAVAHAQDSQDTPPAASNGMPQHAPADPQKMAARLTHRLGLSDDQSSKLLTILQNRQQQIEALRNDSSMSPQDSRQKIHAIQQDSNTQINAILTPDQQTQYAQMQQAMKQRRQNRGAPPSDASGN